LASIKVNIGKGSYYGIRKFKLFLLKTRHDEREVFWNALMRFHGYKTLFTKKITVNLNGKDYQAIFQEEAEKEFLERNNIRETVIIKADDFFYPLKKFSKENDSIFRNNYSISYLIDNRKFLKNKNSLLIASAAISELHSKNSFKNIKNEFFFKKLNEYYAKHALFIENRKFIYYPKDNSFDALYYDGNVTYPTLSKLKKIDGLNQCDVTRSKNLENFENLLKSFSKNKISKKETCIFYHSIKIKQKKINTQLDSSNTNIKSVYSFDQYDFTSVTYEELKYLFKNFLKNKEINPGQKQLNNFDKNYIRYSLEYNGSFYICYYGFKLKKVLRCKKILEDEYKNLISKPINKKRLHLKKAEEFLINLGSINYDYYSHITNLKIGELSKEKNLTLDLREKKIYLINLDNKDFKSLNINLYNNSKIIFNGSLDKGQNIFLNSFSSKENISNKESRYDRFLLTGCITFDDFKFNGGNIYLSGKYLCEDAFNAINSEGSIDNLVVDSGNFDTIDMDFSNIYINHIKVKNANNDCLDLSFGKYVIKNISADFCGDKFISVGESSKVIIENSIVKKSSYGIVSKDNSIVELYNANLSNISKFCISAYNKKNEFLGAILYYKDLSCNNIHEGKKLFKDNLSKVEWRDLR